MDDRNPAEDERDRRSEEGADEGHEERDGWSELTRAGDDAPSDTFRIPRI